MATFKKLSEVTTTSTLADTDLLPAMSAGGIFKKLTWASFKNLVKAAVSPDSATATAAQACDNVMIAYAGKSDGYMRYCKVENWAANAAAGEKALGVLVNDGDCRVIVALDECTSAGLPWASNQGAADCDTPLTNYTSKATAIRDSDGAANTKTILAASKTGFVTNTTDYAAGFCNAYSKTIQYTPSGGSPTTAGIPAGGWHLPAVREMWAIYTHLNELQYALGVTGGTRLSMTGYWCSTEYSSYYAWVLYLSSGTLYSSYKSTSRLRVRPCAAFL